MAENKKFKSEQSTRFFFLFSPRRYKREREREREKKRNTFWNIVNGERLTGQVWKVCGFPWEYRLAENKNKRDSGQDRTLKRVVIQSCIARRLNDTFVAFKRYPQRLHMLEGRSMLLSVYANHSLTKSTTKKQNPFTTDVRNIFFSSTLLCLKEDKIKQNY